MNLSTADLAATTVSSPKLDLIQLTWTHITERYLKRIASNRILTGRVRAIRLLAVHDAIHSVIDPGNGHVYREISEGSTIEAAYTAAVRASHDILAAVFTDTDDREDLTDHLEESLSLIGKEDEKEVGLFSGADSAAAYIRSFAPLIANRGAVRSAATRFRRDLAAA
ncbi:MAG: hypothetical protein V4584_10920 [Verrucomicrobiota bacterium]